MSMPFVFDPEAHPMYLRLPPPPLTNLPLPLPTSFAAAMVGRTEFPTSGCQETRRSEVDLDLALQLQELEINILKDTVAMQKEATQDLRKIVSIQEDTTNHLRETVKDLRERNDDLQQRNSDLCCKNAAHVDQRDKLQEVKIELGELRDEHVELSDNYNRDESLIEELKTKVKKQDETFEDLRERGDKPSTGQVSRMDHEFRMEGAVMELNRLELEHIERLKRERELIIELNAKVKQQEKTIEYIQKHNDRYKTSFGKQCNAINELTAAIKAKYEAFQKLKGEQSVAMSDPSAAYEAKEAELQELKDELKELRDYYNGDEDSTDRLETKVKEQDETIVELNTKVKERDDALSMSQGSVCGLDLTIGVLEEQIEQKDYQIADLENEISYCNCWYWEGWEDWD